MEENKLIKYFITYKYFGNEGALYDGKSVKVAYTKIGAINALIRDMFTTGCTLYKIITIGTEVK